MENLSLEWDCYADESYDITCHNDSIDDLYWADTSQIRPTATPDSLWEILGRMVSLFRIYIKIKIHRHCKQ